MRVFRMCNVHLRDIITDYPYEIEQLTFDLQSCNSLSAFQPDLILNQ